MRKIGFMIAGFQFGMVWAAFFARHGHGYTAHESYLSLFMGCVIYTVWVWA
jgi:hypothetical protein